MNLQVIINCLRLMQLYYHNCHNLVGRQSFYQDHDAFSSMYSEMEGDYDGCVERLIGLKGIMAFNLLEPIKYSLEKIQSLPGVNAKNNKEFFQAALMLENELCRLLNASIKAAETSEGTRNMLAGLADKSEVRQYKIKQRLMA